MSEQSASTATAEHGKGQMAVWPWPDSLDALSAAPQHHTLLLDNDHVRVLETRIPPGHRTQVHTHRWPSVLYVVTWSDWIRRDEAGAVVGDSRTLDGAAPATVAWSPALAPHSLENVGSTEIRVVSVELKQVAG
jgi:hypothetical protein